MSRKLFKLSLDETYLGLQMEVDGGVGVERGSGFRECLESLDRLR